MKVADVLSSIPREDLQSVIRKSDAAGLRILALNYILITACFGLVFFFPTLMSWLLASCILAGRQLGLAILMHDCAHGGLFKTAGANRFFGKWLCAAPVFADLDRYRTYHLEHHRTVGSSSDPDRSNYVGYPVSKSSFRRKILRDLVGITGFKILLMVLKMNAGTVKYQLAYDGNKKADSISLPQQALNLLRGLYPTLIVHSVLIGLLILLGRLEIYGLWWLAWMTWYMLFSRIRNAAEHGATPDINDLDPLKNTRTTLASWWERLTVAPNFVNYHLEHHLLATVPPHNLARFHAILHQHGALATSKIARGYGEVISDLTSRQ